jgi:hypothetical protein
MDYLLRLPADLAGEFRTAVEIIEKELVMPYVTSWEQLARQEGMVQGAVEMLLQALEVRFGEVPAALLEKIQQCQDVDKLRALHKQALTAGSLDELQF